MIHRVAPGDGFPLAKADALNEVAAAVNQVNSESASATPGAGLPPSHCVVRVGYTGSNPLPERSIVRVYEAERTYEAAPDEFVHSPSFLAAEPEASQPGCLAVLLRELVSGGVAEALLVGTATVKVSVTDAAHRYARAVDGDTAKLQSAASGEFRLLSFETVTASGGDPETGEQWCTVFFPAAGPNLHADDASKAYTIDRTVAADDGKAWHPADNLPEDWADYDCVKLVVGYLRYDSTAGTLTHVTQEYHYAASHAPVIPAASVTAAVTGSC